MAEILTESFCERCGTRYTFESAQPRGRGLGALGTLGRGLRNFVVMTDSSLDEAMAAARSETDQRVTTAQLEAFHRTFNFCLTCRQYTCSDCWNAVEGRCLTCAPRPEAEIALPTVTVDPTTVAAALAVDAAPVEAAAAVDTFPADEAVPADDTVPADEAAPLTPLAELDVAAPLESEPQAPSEPAALVELPAEAEPAQAVVAESDDTIGAAADREREPAASLETPAPESMPEPEPVATAEPLAEAQPVGAAEPGLAAEPAPAPAVSDATPAQVALPEFLPGRSLDDEISAYELRIAALAETPPEPLPPIVVAATPPRAPAVRAQAASRPLPVAPVSSASMPPAAAAPGTCRSCGLSLSASARFCRRCGTAQVA